MTNPESSTPKTLRPWSESLDTLRTLADLSESLTLVFVVGPHGKATKALAQIGDLLGDRRAVLWHRVDRDGADLASTLATAQDPDRSVLLVHGLELVEEDERSVLARTLNLRRDALSPYKSIVAFWIAQDFLRDFRRLCSDFFHWRSLLVTLTEEELEADIVTRWRYIDEAVSWLQERVRGTDSGVNALVEVEGRPAPLSLTAWVAGISRGRLAGTLGSQRTAALQRAAMDLMRRVRNDILEPLPIWMPLREAETPATEEDIAAILGACPGGSQLSVTVFRSWIRHGDLYFVLDGLDDLPRDRRTSWQQWIDRQRTRHPGNRFLVTISPGEEQPTGWDRATVISPRRELKPTPRSEKRHRMNLSSEATGQGVIQTERSPHSPEHAVSFSSLLSSLDPRRNADSQARARAAKSLGRRAGVQAVSALIRSLDPEVEPAGSVRVSAATALGRMQDRRAVDALTRSLNPEFEIDGAVRRSAAKGLGKTTAETTRVPAAEAVGVRPRLVRADLYGAYVGVLRWLDLKDHETLAVEDGEHLDRRQLDEVRLQILAKLRERGLRPTEARVDRLVAELLQTSTESDVARRQRTPHNLAEILRATDEELTRWSATARAVAVRAAFDEVYDIGGMLHDGTRAPRENPTPGQLLAAAHEIVPFHTKGRSAELDALDSWCSAEPRVSVWLWTGDGGVGKTRLMIEWCHRLRGQNWHAGFLHRQLDDGIERLFEGAAPRLIVVAYAETCLEVIRALLFRLATVGDGPRCRVVLLARRQGDWWRRLRQDEEVEELIAESPEPRRLGALDIDRDTAFREAFSAFADARGDGNGEIPAPTLAGGDYDRILYLHMAALAAVGGEPVGDASDTLTKVLEHERHFWIRSVNELDLESPQKQLLEKAVPQAVAALTLIGGGDKDHAPPVIATATQSLALTDVARAALDKLLLSIYGDGGDFGGLEPDLLGEELVAACLFEEAALLDRVLDIADERGRTTALTVLTRLARRRSEEERWLARAFEGHLEELAETALAVAVEVGDPVGRVLAGFVSGVSGELAKRLMDRCDQNDYAKSVPLREVACEASRRWLEFLREIWPKPDPEQLLVLTRAESNLGLRLSDLGRREEALEATREAVEVRRRLTAARPDVDLPALALSLNNLGVWLSDLGRREEALEASREATEILQRLAASRPDAFLHELAQSLNNLGKMLSGVGRYKEALEATREAIDIRRRLVAARLHDSLPTLAQSLNNLGADLSALGRREETVEASREAVEIDRQLVASRPDAFLPDLAQSLSNLGNGLSDVGRHKEALEAASEAVEIRRRLAMSRPDAFLPDLALSLNNLGNRLSDVGRRKEAFETVEEAVQTLAPFFARLPEAFADRMRVMVRHYERRAADAGRLVDGEFLGPVLARLERLGKDG